VVSHVGVFLVLEAKGRDGLSEPDLVANGVLYLSVQDVPAIDVNILRESRWEGYGRDEGRDENVRIPLFKRLGAIRREGWT
jgi:hypothetical protein